MFDLRLATRACRPGISRRDLVRAGALGFGGLTLAELFHLRALGAKRATADRPRSPAAAGRGKSVIWIWLRGGPSHIDSWDMKPQAPVEFRGEFRPIATNVPGIAICEHLPRQAAMMDRLAIIRGVKSNDLGDHTPHYILTGFPDRGKRPSLGAICSYLKANRASDGVVSRGTHDGISPAAGMPAYVSSFKYSYEASTYTGPQHRPFVPDGAGLKNLERRRELTVARLESRRELLGQLDTIRRDIDKSGVFDSLDAHTRQAIDIVTSAGARDAFDLSREPRETHERYGKYCQSLLMARRLVEAGVSIVTVKIGDWDTHEHNFRDMREQLPQLDQGFHALISDLYDRGLEKDVAVVVWGEFGRAPRISRIDGRDHWPEAGAAVLAGGGFPVGQVIGETDSKGARSVTRPYTPGNILATLYRHLGIDPAQTIPGFDGRPMYILDDREPVRELL
jgi:hypothetical protein